ncbi:MAG: cupin domain-containing protein [Candidatus Aenigmarchaeota archaeon]|nr:cupin domain-containing protein [Candidatus Aenigmarchaeota archaeon]
MEIRYRDKLEAFVTKDKSEIREYFHSLNLSLAEALLKPGQVTQYHLHKKSEEIYYILDGKGLMNIEGKESEVAEKQAIYIAPGKRHKITNVGEKPLIFLCACSPAYSDEDTLLED